MNIITTLKNVFSGQKFSSLEAEKEQALVDALTYAVAVDHRVEQEEEEELAEAVDQLDWKGSGSAREYVHESLERARRLAGQPDKMEPHLLDISSRLGEDWLREEAYYLAARVVASDEAVVDQEQQLMRTMVAAFGIDSQTQARITDQIVRETEFE